MSVDNHDLFEMVKLASFENDFKISCSAFTESKNFVYGVLVSENKKIHFCHCPKHRKEEKQKRCHSPSRVIDNFKIQNIEWFSNESLKVKNISFNPLGDYCLVLTENFDLYVICIERMLVNNEMVGKASSGLSWNKEIVTGVFTAPRSELELGSPSVVLWWETCDFIQLGFVGTDEGHIVVLNLVTGQMLSSTSITGPVTELQVMMDSALDSVHLVVSSTSQQWRVLIEQRSTGYTWGCTDCPPSPPRHTSSAQDTEPGQRSRLQSIKQLSVDRIANLRHKLSEGRRMLRTRSETEDVTAHSRPEVLTGQFGNTWFTVHNDLQQHKYFLSGLISDKSLLTLYNTEMEILNQSNFKLPPSHPDKVSINGKLILAYHQNSHRISVSSTVLAEIKTQTQNFKPESVLQNFQLDKDERVLQFNYVQLFQSPEPSSNGISSKSPFRKLVCVTKNENGDLKKVLVNKKGAPETLNYDDTKDLTISSSPASLFEQKTKTNIDAMKRNCQYSDPSGGYVLVTSKAIYLLRLTDSPVDYFLGSAMQGKMKLCDILARSFCLEKPGLVELAGDIRLYQGDVASAVSLYRQAATKHVKTALKLAASGHVTELLSFLQAVFTSQNTEVSSGDRIHLSNLSLMGQFQQLCSSSVSRYYLEEKILHFLKTNKWYDLGLAIVQCLECGLLRMLAVLTRHLGVEGEVGAGLGRQDLTSLSSSLTTDCRQELLGLLLLPHLVPSTLDCPGATVSILTFLTSVLPSMTSCQLSSVLHNTCPARRDLQLMTRSQSVRQSLLELFLLAALHLLRRKAESGEERVERSLVQMLSPGQNPVEAGDIETREISVRSRLLSCGHSHALFRSGELLSWGGGGEGRLGRGRLTVPTSGPGEVALLTGSTILSVSCGKQHSLALTNSGLYVWGCNKYGQLGLGLSFSLLAMATTPRHLTLVEEVCQVSAGQYHTLCIDRAGRVFSWGWNVHGQVGVGGIDDVTSPRLVRGLAGYRVVQVEAGYAHSVALTSCGTVLAWGCGLFGQLGGGDTSKQSRPVKVSLPAPVSNISVGYFHCLALLQTGQLMVWGANPQILRLEAQQRKKEKLLQKQLEEKRRQEEAESESVETGESCLESLDPQDTNTSSESHLTPSTVHLSNLAGERIAAVTAGSQHSLILSQSGKLFGWGRNLEGQLGLGNRTSVKVPTLISALAEETVVEVGAGADFTLAVIVSGTVFGWGSNTGGQLGRPPLEPGTDQQDNSRLVVMKTTKRIIRLQHGLQNSCDQPRPVQGIPRTGVYSDSHLGQSDTISSDMLQQDNLHHKLPSLEPVFSTKLLQKMVHVTMEEFHQMLDHDTMTRHCLVLNNFQAAAKLSFLGGKYNQAFDMNIQALMRLNTGVEDSLLEALLYYCSCPVISREEKCQIFERLVSCWQDNNFSNQKLESFLLNFQDGNLVNIIILTLFCPSSDSDPNQRTSSDTQLVDYFSPEFNLRIGDIFTKSVGSSDTENGLDITNQLSIMVEEDDSGTVQ